MSVCVFLWLCVCVFVGFCVYVFVYLSPWCNFLLETDLNFYLNKFPRQKYALTPNIVTDSEPSLIFFWCVFVFAGLCWSVLFNFLNALAVKIGQKLSTNGQERSTTFNTVKNNQK